MLRSLFGIAGCSQAGNPLEALQQRTVINDDKALVIHSALLFAIRLRDAEGFRRWLEAGLDELGLVAVEALLLDEVLPVLTDQECDRIVAWRLGVSL